MDGCGEDNDWVILGPNGELRIGEVWIGDGSDFVYENRLTHIMKALLRRRRCISPFMVFIRGDGPDNFLLEHGGKLTIMSPDVRGTACYVGIISMNEFERWFIRDLRRYCAKGGVNEGLDVKQRKRETRRLGRLLEEYDELTLPWSRKAKRRYRKPRGILKRRCPEAEGQGAGNTGRRGLKKAVLKKLLSVVQDSSSMSEFRIRADLKSLKGVAAMLKHYEWNGDWQKFKEETQFDLDFLKKYAVTRVVNMSPVEGTERWRFAADSGSPTWREMSFGKLKSRLAWLGVDTGERGNHERILRS